MTILNVMLSCLEILMLIFYVIHVNKSSAVAEMGDRGHNRHGRSVTKKVGNQTMLCFPTHLSSGSALPCETGNPEIVSFHLNTVCCFATNTKKHIQIITWSLLNYPSFLKWSTVCIGQLKPT